ncbi:phage tail protein [Breoghania sp. L-A4]|uniref:phage tail protein n=1 Tax=Breoghania sp. L-A4 TaxID=2304600 RepID=UPI000E358429|nr:phage tail protein [Breoghania sp. L-A4]AXS39280.1 oxidoreductase [Breoghania sp. L-A4]
MRTDQQEARPHVGTDGNGAGAFAFQALGFSYTDVARRLSTPWAKVAVAQRLDAQQWTGPGEDEVSIKGVLFPEEFGGGASLDGLRAAALVGVPLMLVSLGGRVFGYHTIQGIDEDRGFHDAFGAPRRNAYVIKLLRYTGSPSPSAFNSFVSLFA